MNTGDGKSSEVDPGAVGTTSKSQKPSLGWKELIDRAEIKLLYLFINCLSFF